MKLRSSHRSVIADVQRYQVARLDLLFSRFPMFDANAAIRSLATCGRLRIEQHAAGFDYVYLPGPKAPSATSVARALTVHAHFGEAAGVRRLLTKAEFRQYFPTVFCDGLPQHYYVDLSHDVPRLGHIRVDVKPADVRHITKQIRQLIHRHLQLSAFRSLVASGQFEITLLVATEVKARVVRQSLGSLANAGIPLNVERVPLLLNLLAPLSCRDSPGTTSDVHSRDSLPDVEGLKRLLTREQL